ncbi:galactose-1-phosphate uridylyltransferase [Rhodococcus aerolatus]
MTLRRLADGREIRYFDAPGTAAARDAVDRRDLPRTTTSSTLRYDALLGEWVVVASHRQSRTFLPPADACPLCPSTPGRATEVPEPAYQVVSLENRFPSLSGAGDEPGAGGPGHAPGAPLAVVAPGSGRCEVLCFTDRHDLTFAELDPARARLVVEAWAHRTTELSALPGVAQVFCFENHGEEIGVTLSHPHGQVYAYPFLTPRVATVLGRVAAHREAHGRNLFADVLAAERDGPRVVAANEHWTAFVPAAARWPHEVQLFCHRQVPDVPALTAAERDAFVEVYLGVLRRFAHRFAEPMNYIAAWNQGPTGAGRDDWWLHLQLFSFRRAEHKLKYLAGSESGMGVFVNDTTAEDVAAALRAVVLP